MNNIIIGVKRFLSNKNTVTIIGIVVAVLVLYIGYNYRIDQATSPVKVAYAKETIQPKTEITEEMISYMEVPASAIQGDVIISAKEVIGHYSNYNTVIPAGSMFYEDTVVDFDRLPDAAFKDVAEGFTVFNFPVDIESTYGNSLFPGNYIDVYFYCINDAGEVMYGQLYSNIEILAVKDNDGVSVFQSSEELGKPSMLLFAIPNEQYLILKKATYLTENDAEIIVVPVTADVKGTTPKITSSSLVAFIEAKTASVPQDVIDDAYDESTDESDTKETE